MPEKDFFGILDRVKTLIAPAGMEAVHQDGYSWAKSGETFARSTVISAADWNALIGNFRGLLTAAGVDLSDLDERSPLILREFILRYIIAQLPGVVADQMPVLADLLDTDADLIAALQASIPLNLNASNLTSGTVPDGRLNAAAILTGEGVIVNDANAFLSGSGRAYSGYTGGMANFPSGNVWKITASKHSTRVRQWIYSDNMSVTLPGYKFVRQSVDNGATWSTWEPIHETQTEMDARYAQKAGSAGQAFATAALTASGAFSGASGTFSTTLGVTGAATFGSTVAITGTLTRGGNTVRDNGNTPDGSVALAQAGTDTTTRVWGADDLKAAAQTWGGGIGSGQTRSAPTYAAMTSYQNSTGRPIAFTVRKAGGNMGVDYSPDNSTWTRIAWQVNSGSAVTAIIKNGEYYRFTNAPDEVTLLS